MLKIIQINVTTGERTEREMTAEEIAQIPVQPVIEAQPVDPVEKLKAFLFENPDVVALVQLGSQ